MARLIFYDDDHRYTVDGEEVPSVSELTRFVTREVYEEAPQWALDTGKVRGTKVHRATEALDKFGDVECDEDIVQYVQAYVQFRKDINPEWEQIEWPICNGMLYAGTLDRYGTMNGKKAIVDIKTTQHISGMHKVGYRAQLNLYRLAAIQSVAVDELWVLQLKKDGTYKLHQMDVDEPLAQACITLHEAFKQTKRRKKKDG